MSRVGSSLPELSAGLRPSSSRFGTGLQGREPTGERDAAVLGLRHRPMVTEGVPLRRPTENGIF
jgi:hypothetical protein